ncbi:MAG: PAS domain S-box protein [Bacteroidota bacterium]
MTDLRSRAEALARNISNAEIEVMSAWDTNKLIQEFQVYQVELEMQNEELTQYSDKLQKANDKYADLYDSAPVGYVKLSQKTGKMSEINLAVTQFLGVERRWLQGENFAQYIAPQDLNEFYIFFKEIFETRHKHMCELHLRPKHGSPVFVRLEGTEVEDASAPSRSCQIVVIDINERKKMEEELDEKVRVCTAELEHQVSLLKAEIEKNKNRRYHLTIQTHKKI